MYQSVLTDLEWGDVAGVAVPHATAGGGGRRPALDQVQRRRHQPRLHARPTSCRGRIVGTIGPAAADEPHQLVLGRHFLTTSLPPGPSSPPPARSTSAWPVVDAEAGQVCLDLGNALPTDGTSAIADIGLLTLGYLAPTNTGGVRFTPIDTLPAAAYTAAAWYPDTAGVLELPASRALTSGELDAIAENPLVVILTDAQGRRAMGIAEPSDGLYVRADQFVFRMSPGDHQDIEVYATSFGQPYAGARVIAVLDPSQLQGGQGVPPVGIPVDAVDFPARVTADDQGLAVLPITAADPGNPRGYIDGQVYGVRPVLEDTVYQPSPYPYNPSDFVSLLVWTGFHPAEDPVTWLGSLQPIMEQYENLYPVMKRFVRLGDYESVCENRRMLQLAFGLDSENPNFMPVTRDLSTAKQAAVLAWLARLGPDGKPLLGTSPTPPPPGRDRLAIAPEAVPGPAPAAKAAGGRGGGGPAQGGKAAALARRRGANRSSVLPTDADLADADADADADDWRDHVIYLRQSLAEALDAGGKDEVCTALQEAIELEHSTIPPYLYALYSLIPGKNDAVAEIIQSIVVEEMLHLTLAANILNALGGSPVLDTPDFIPDYPGPLPGSVEGGLVVPLAPCSLYLVSGVFMKIEQPERPWSSPSSGRSPSSSNPSPSASSTGRSEIRSWPWATELSCPGPETRSGPTRWTGRSSSPTWPPPPRPSTSSSTKAKAPPPRPWRWSGPATPTTTSSPRSPTVDGSSRTPTPAPTRPPTSSISTTSPTSPCPSTPRACTGCPPIPARRRTRPEAWARWPTTTSTTPTPAC